VVAAVIFATQSGEAKAAPAGAERAPQQLEQPRLANPDK
jgi:hypothetical protein